MGIRKANKGGNDDKVDYEVSDLEIGYILDYDFTSWEVQDKAVYTWENGVKDYEFTLFDGKVKRYLYLEASTGRLSMYEGAKINEIWPAGKSLMRKGANLMDEEIKFKGNTYYFYAEAAAKVRNKSESYMMENWLFLDAAEHEILSFNLYEDRSMDAYIGHYLKPHEISNILPR
jgi:hypothetical protein